MSDPLPRSFGVSADAAAALTCVVVKPVGLTTGDLMVAHITFADDATITDPTDWTEIRQDRTATNSDRSSYLGWKIADAGDVAATDFTFTSDMSATSAGAITAWTAGTFNASNPINANNGQVNAASNIAPTITPSVAGCAICLFVMSINDVDVSAYAITTSNPASWAEAYELKYTAGIDLTAAMGYSIRPETTATGDGTWTSSSSENNIGQMIAIEPSGGAPPATTKINKMSLMGVA